jgi:ATP-binding cassette, subfamily F, member 3
MISVNKINVSFGGFDLLKDINFIINKGDRIGLTGKNGAGKTTLLKLLAGISEPSTGEVVRQKDTSVGYLPQQIEVKDTCTLIEETMLAFSELLRLEKNIARLNKELTSTTDFHSENYLKKLDRLNEINDRYSILGGDTYQADLEQTLLGLGFERTDFNRHTSEFSGGWRMRIELAKLLLKKPDIILLDEPTNHLDIESIQWLENFLKNYKGAVMLVSHDKAFLEAVCNRIMEISLGKITDQKMAYSEFVEWKKEQREINLAAHRNQQKMIEDTEKFIERFRYKATKAIQVQSRIKQLDKLKRIEIEETDKAELKIHFPPVPSSGRVVIEAKNISKSFGDNLVLSNINLTVERGDKIAFVGRNGEGKTTLVKIILQQLEHEGKIKTGHNVKIGYFAQNQSELLNNDLTVLETIDEIAVGEIRTKIRDLLGAFLFSGDDVDKKVKVLSGGEKSKLAMIRLMLNPVNLLVLDEPTNHFDMQSKEILKEALIHFKGTVIIVSHDRDFLDGIVNCVYEFRNKAVKQHLGGIYNFLERKNLESMQEYEKAVLLNSQRRYNKEKSGNGNGQKDFEERKEINRNISRIEKKISETELNIEKLEEELSAVNHKFSAEEVHNNTTIFESYDTLQEELSKMLTTWEELHTELENWQLKKTW